jgi:hypothetical protein
MKPKDENKEIDINEIAITIEVDSEVIDKVRSGEVTHVCLQLNEDNQELVLQTIEGHLILVTENMPKNYCGCYLYNNGEFPYAIKDTLKCLVLNSGKDDCLTRIIGVEVEPAFRFYLPEEGKPIKENPNGDCCVWEITFEVVPVPDDRRTYLMRWNPSISSFTEKDYGECVEQMENDMFRMNWSIREWEEARRGDMFFMMRVGDDKAGIVFDGQFISDPYPGDDWQGSTKRRMYVDMVCTNPIKPTKKPRVSLEKLQENIPEFDWAKGHSGALLSEEITTKLINLCEGEE